MPLKAKYDKEEDIPEKYRDLFELRNEKWVLVNIEGIATEANVHRLEGTVKNLREERDALKQKVTAFGDRTPEAIHAMEDRVQELEAQLATGGTKDEEKINQLVEARIKTKLGPVERELKQTKEELAAEKERTGSLAGVIRSGRIADAVRKAAAEQKVVPTAVDDLIMLAERVMDVEEDEEGNVKVYTRDKVGVPPGIGPTDWIAELAPKKPHIFHPSVGAGSNGGAGSGGVNGNNPWAKQNWNLTRQGEFLRTHGREKADQYAKAVGSFVGATAPPQPAPNTK